MYEDQLTFMPTDDLTTFMNGIADYNLKALQYIKSKYVPQQMTFETFTIVILGNTPYIPDFDITQFMKIASVMFNIPEPDEYVRMYRCLNKQNKLTDEETFNRLIQFNVNSLRDIMQYEYSLFMLRYYSQKGMLDAAAPWAERVYQLRPTCDYNYQ